MSRLMPNYLPRSPRTLLALVAFLLACGPRHAPAAGPVPRDLPLELGQRSHLRVLLIGDTGLDNAAMASVKAAVKAETKDVIVALGDIVYPEAPPCPSGRLTPSAMSIMDQSAGATLLGLGAPVLVVLGNHDVGHGVRDPAREACILHYAASRADLVMPDLTWVVDAGVVTLVGLNTNALDDEQARLAARALGAAKGWTVFVGHHVLKTFHDKTREDRVRPWLAKHALKPDIFANAHAHLQQLGVYGDVIAVTSGAAALPRDRPACPPGCLAGQLFGHSAPGYAVLDFTAERVEITFHDTTGKTLHRSSHTRRPAAQTPDVAPKEAK